MAGDTVPSLQPQAPLVDRVNELEHINTKMKLNNAALNHNVQELLEALNEARVHVGLSRIEFDKTVDF
jgi:hypothetical protein